MVQKTLNLAIDKSDKFKAPNKKDLWTHCKHAPNKPHIHNNIFYWRVTDLGPVKY